LLYACINEDLPIRRTSSELIHADTKNNLPNNKVLAKSCDELPAKQTPSAVRNTRALFGVAFVRAGVIGVVCNRADAVWRMYGLAAGNPRTYELRVRDWLRVARYEENPRLECEIGA